MYVLCMFSGKHRYKCISIAVNPVLPTADFNKSYLECTRSRETIYPSLEAQVPFSRNPRHDVKRCLEPYYFI